MAKKLRGNRIDPLFLKKIDTIVHEIETLHGQDIGIKDIYNKISIYLEEEPSLTVPLVDALAKLPKPKTAQLLEEMLAEAKEKIVSKAIKGALYRLTQRGVQWEKKSSVRVPVLKAPERERPEGYVGSFDQTGSRLIIVARSVPARGFLTLLCVINDTEGLVEFSANQFSKKGFRRFLEEDIYSADFPVVEAEGAYCVHLLKEASSLNARLSRPLPQGYRDIEREFEDISWDGTVPIIYEHIQEEDIKGEIHLLNDSKTLHEVFPFSSWFIDPEELQDYVLQIKEAEESRIVLSSYQRNERRNTIYKDALEKLFPEDKRLLWKRRLEEMAYILIKTDREDDAKMALSAAINLKNPLSPIEPNPFIWELLLKSLHSNLEEDYDEEEQKEKSSLIITR